MNSEELNKSKNRTHYNQLYSNFNIRNTLHWLNNLEVFLNSALTTETSWFALYQENFKERLKGAKVLEMGCGDCVNAAVMAALGAKVYANDIAEVSGAIITKLNQNYDFTTPIKFISGDFLQNNIKAESFDFVVGKAFLHHLELPLEKQFLKETARLLKPGGEARFFEPAVNNGLLNVLRWYVPVKGRPSKFNVKAFREWKESDPHPERSFSSQHFEEAGKEFFKEIRILPVGSLERFSRLMKWGEARNNYRKWALEKEMSIPYSLNRSFARSQLIVYKNPKGL